MATLIVDNLGRKSAAVFDGRLLIGRRTGNAVAVNHPDVSRIHAWIDRSADSFYVGDAGSRTGTVVNGVQIVERRPLNDGDEIAIGPATMTFRLNGDLPPIPPDIGRFQVTRHGTAQDSDIKGVLMSCPCGAPIWVPPVFSNRWGRCRSCGDKVRIPAHLIKSSSDATRSEPPSNGDSPSMLNDSDGMLATAMKSTRSRTSKSRRPPPPPAVLEVCSVCQSAILPSDHKVACIGCELSFHTECWEENRGCSAYGCAQVNSIESSEDDEADADESVQTSTATEESVEGHPGHWIPVQWVLLAGSLLSSVIGAFTFGVPALLVVILSVVYANRVRHEPKGRAGQAGRGGRGKAIVAIVAASVALGGAAAGVMLSRFWWFNEPVWGLPALGGGR